VSATPLDASTPPRRERSGEATRRRILDAAETEFAAKGFDGARLAAIARAADAPQALIHHYFDDKIGLHGAVIERALASITAEGWRILDTMAPPRRRGHRKRFEKRELGALIEAFVGMLVDFYATHARVLRILQHEAARGGRLGHELLRAHVKPQLEDVVARFDDMRERGEVRKDVDARQLCLSAVSMACFPFQDPAFVSTVWSLDPFDREFIERHKRETVTTLMARIVPWALLDA
jgi:AcrR family transcriptional regulator